MLWLLYKDSEIARVFDDEDGVTEDVSIKDYNYYRKNVGKVFKPNFGFDKVQCEYSDGFYVLYTRSQRNNKANIFYKGELIISTNVGYRGSYQDISIHVTDDKRYAKVEISYVDKHYYREDSEEFIERVIIIDASSDSKVLLDTGFSVAHSLPYYVYENGRWGKR